MKSIPGIITCLYIFLASCSPYQKVSSSNFRDYGIQEDELEHLHFVLKKKELHYTNEAGQNNYHRHNKQDGSLTESYSVLVENNLVIPKGADGSCVKAENDQLFIDFGDGIVIPFRVHGDDNSPAAKISVDQRTYSILVLNRTASLYFEVIDLSRDRAGIKRAN